MPDLEEQDRAYQAAEREDHMVGRFNLISTNEGRAGRDAVLPLNPENDLVPFELKSTDGDSISTARDVGRSHIEKWRRQHWLFGFYERGSRNPPRARFYIYASPRQLAPWIDELAAYVEVDWGLVETVPQSVDEAILDAVLAPRDLYTLEDAQRVFKQQKLEIGEHTTTDLRRILEEAGVREPRRMTAPVYRALMDRRAGFSADRVREMVGALTESTRGTIEAQFQETGDFGFDNVYAALRGAKLAEGGTVTRAWLREHVDSVGGYSRQRMLAMLRERCRYLLDRGATRNNPHVGLKRLEALVPADHKISGTYGDFAAKVRELVRRERQ